MTRICASTRGSRSVAPQANTAAPDGVIPQSPEEWFQISDRGVFHCFASRLNDWKDSAVLVGVCGRTGFVPHDVELPVNPPGHLRCRDCDRKRPHIPHPAGTPDTTGGAQEAAR